LPLIVAMTLTGFVSHAIHGIRPWIARTPKPVQALVAHLRTALKDGF